MSNNEMAIAALAIIFGSVFGIVVISKIFGLIKTWINRNSSPYDDEKFDRLAKAFIQHKKDVNRRLQNIEGNTGREKTKSAHPANKLRNNERSHTSIEIEEHDKANQPQKKSDSGHLRNMLNN